MRFSTPEEVTAAAEKWAKELYTLHIQKGHDLNPYTTEGARNEFRRGYENAPPYSWEQPTRDFDYRYKVGAAVARIVQNHNKG